MNRLPNGNIAVGAPGSLMRVRAEYPEVIDRLNSLFNQEAKIDEAVESIRAAGISSEMETSNLILASHYGEGASTPGSVAHMVCRFQRP